MKKNDLNYFIKLWYWSKRSCAAVSALSLHDRNRNQSKNEFEFEAQHRKKARNARTERIAGHWLGTKNVNTESLKKEAGPNHYSVNNARSFSQFLHFTIWLNSYLSICLTLYLLETEGYIKSIAQKLNMLTLYLRRVPRLSKMLLS